MDQADLAATPPDWLPSSLVSTWLFLDGYPWVLALVVAAGGLVLATLARALILFWGLKVAARTRTDLDEKLVRLGAWVAALSVVNAPVLGVVLPIGVLLIVVLTIGPGAIEPLMTLAVTELNLGEGQADRFVVQP